MRISLAKGESSHRYPQFLPDGRHFLYFKASLDPNLIGAYIGERIQLGPPPKAAE